MASKFDKMEMPRKKIAAEPEEIKLELDEEMGPESEAMEVEVGPNVDVGLPEMIKQLEAAGYKVVPPASEEAEDGVVIAKPVGVTGGA